MISQLQNALTALVEDSSKKELHSLGALIEQLVKIQKAAGAIYFVYDNLTGNWQALHRSFASSFSGDPELCIQEALTHLPDLAKTKQSAIKQIEQIEGFYKFFIVPIVFEQNLEGFVCLIAESINKIEAIRQLLDLQWASGFFLYHKLQSIRHKEHWGLEQASQLLDIVQNALGSNSLDEAALSIANDLEQCLQCDLVAIGKMKGGTATLLSISKKGELDKRSSHANSIQNSMQEACLLGNDLFQFPTQLEKGSERTELFEEHQQLFHLLQATHILTLPLNLPATPEQASYCVLCAWGKEHSLKSSQSSFLQAAAPYLAQSLEIALKAQPSRMLQLGRAVKGKLSKNERRLLITVGVLTLFLLFTPYVHRIRANVTLEPVKRRVIEAPFRSTLKKSLIEPGMVVKEGQLLAILDDKDLVSQISELQANYSQALKEGETALAKGDPAKARISQLEAEKLGAQLDLLDKRREKLQITSPFFGMIVEGDLHHMEGSPFNVGEKLLEIAPLEKMYAEVEIPQADIPYVHVDQPVKIRLEAFPAKKLEARTAYIRPRAVIRDGKNVFVAPVEIDNPNALLRPGMKGRATVLTARKPLYWLLFHKAWDFARMYFFW